MFRYPLTTWFALMAAIGAGIVTAIRTGILDGSTLPNWVNAVAGILTIIGSAGTGIFAADGKKVAAQLDEHEQQIKGNTEFITKTLPVQGSAPADHAPALPSVAQVPGEPPKSP